MRKFALVSMIALAAAIPTVANAQPAPRGGHSWGERGERVMVRHGGRMMDDRRGHRPRVQFRRIQRGHAVPGFWFGPQFHVQQWQMYGFPQPMPGHRWIRYYDDALMIDGRGRVRDGRYGFDWDRYDDRWAYDERGIPYAGEDDYYDEDRGYDREERYGRHHSEDWDYGEYGRGHSGRGGHGGCAPAPRPAPCGGAYASPPHGYRHGGCAPAPRPAPCGGAYAYPAPGYGYGHGQAYGYGYGGGTVTITETTVTTGGASSSYYEEIVEEEVVSRPRVRRVHRRPARPVRRPIRGERG